MGLPTLAVAMMLVAPAQSDDPELVVIPLEAEGVKPQAGIDAWKVVVSEIAKAKSKLKVAVTLQKEIHDLLLGPAREQARDCGDNLTCLREIGKALDAKQIIAGKVTKDEVSLFALDIGTGAKIAAAKSPAGRAKAKPEAKSKAATQALVAAMIKARKKSDAVAAASEPASNGHGAKAEPEKTEPAKLEPAKTKVEPAKTKAEPAKTAAADPQPAGGDDLKDDPKPAAEATPPVEPSATQGKLRIPPDQLEGIARVTVDGSALETEPDGAMVWTGAPGSHSLFAERRDGNKLSKDVVVDAGRTNDVRLEFPALASSPPPGAAKPVDDDVTSKWWFWTAIATAVVAGGATTVVLAGGLKGGPEVPSGFGSVTGTY